MSRKNIRPKIKPPKQPADENTKFHIDDEWWERSTLDFHSNIITRLHGFGFADVQWDSDVNEVDIVSMETGEVSQVDGFQYVVQTYFSQLPEDFARTSTLVEATFCLLLANANQPLTAGQIAERTDRPADVVIRTLDGPKTYLGIVRVS